MWFLAIAVGYPGWPGGCCELSSHLHQDPDEKLFRGRGGSSLLEDADADGRNTAVWREKQKLGVWRNSSFCLPAVLWSDKAWKSWNWQPAIETHPSDPKMGLAVRPARAAAGAGVSAGAGGPRAGPSSRWHPVWGRCLKINTSLMCFSHFVGKACATTCECAALNSSGLWFGEIQRGYNVPTWISGYKGFLRISAFIVSP